MIVRHVSNGQVCVDPVWEQAYQRFETPEEEIQKFIGRLKTMGIESYPRNARVLELFCGRGNGLIAIRKLGFNDVEGLDLSESLLEQYPGAETLHLADCRAIPMRDHSYEIVIVQGGLHHLPELELDLPKSLSEIRRILTPNGAFFLVEPWPTPFLRLAHAITNLGWIRLIYRRGDALATMTEQEHETYYRWLHQSRFIQESLGSFFRVDYQRIGWGKMMMVGCPQ